MTAPTRTYTAARARRAARTRLLHRVSIGVIVVGLVLFTSASVTGAAIGVALVAAGTVGTR